MTFSDLEINISDNSAKEFANDFQHQLETLFDNTDTQAMSDYQRYLQGRKDMLQDIIQYLKTVKPS